MFSCCPRKSTLKYRKFEISEVENEKCDLTKFVIEEGILKISVFEIKRVNCTININLKEFL